MSPGEIIAFALSSLKLPNSSHIRTKSEILTMAHKALPCLLPRTPP